MEMAVMPGEAAWEFILYMDNPCANYLGFVVCSS